MYALTPFWICLPMSANGPENDPIKPILILPPPGRRAAGLAASPDLSSGLAAGLSSGFLHDTAPARAMIATAAPKAARWDMRTSVTDSVAEQEQEQVRASGSRPARGAASDPARHRASSRQPAPAAPRGAVASAGRPGAGRE